MLERNRKDFSARKFSGLPSKFTDRECAAYEWMWDKAPWLVDLLDKSVRDGKGNKYANLIVFAQAHGWEG